MSGPDTGQIKGPLSNVAVRETRDRDVGLLQVKVLRMEDAWKDLSRS